jgi:hypothetical protein
VHTDATPDGLPGSGKGSMASSGIVNNGMSDLGAGIPSSRGLWMNEIQEDPGKVVAHPRIQLPSVPVIAHETCRETLGVCFVMSHMKH